MRDFKAPTSSSEMPRMSYDDLKRNGLTFTSLVSSHLSKQTDTRESSSSTKVNVSSNSKLSENVKSGFVQRLVQNLRAMDSNPELFQPEPESSSSPVKIIRCSPLLQPPRISLATILEVSFENYGNQSGLRESFSNRGILSVRESISNREPISVRDSCGNREVLSSRKVSAGADFTSPQVELQISQVSTPYHESIESLFYRISLLSPVEKSLLIGKVPENSSQTFRKVADWVLLLCTELKLSRLTAHLAITMLAPLIDKLELEKVQVTTAVLVLLAAKAEEVRPPYRAQLKEAVEGELPCEFEVTKMIGGFPKETLLSLFLELLNAWDGFAEQLNDNQFFDSPPKFFAKENAAYLLFRTTMNTFDTSIIEGIETDSLEMTLFCLLYYSLINFSREQGLSLSGADLLFFAFVDQSKVISSKSLSDLKIAIDSNRSLGELSFKLSLPDSSDFKAYADFLMLQTYQDEGLASSRLLYSSGVLSQNGA